MNRHSSQYALPGGRIDNDEKELEASLRELKEELGVELGPEHLLGTLDDYATRSGFQISPLVFWAHPPIELEPNPEEVDQIYHIPLEELDDPSIPILTDSSTCNHPVLSAYLPTLGQEIFAPTAAILYQFREVAFRGLHTRVIDYDQPIFAWR